ncbi:unnamed protein product, partial [Mesorhabditis belari]|uniref:Chitinase n=1 Tax=Mesorhabditis belari TaxID=2138241 RepID=A0AAF3EJ38_9BILA
MLRPLCIGAFFALYTVTAHIVVVSCPPGWLLDVRFKSCYKVIIGGFTFTQGVSKCKEINGTLASIHSYEEDMLINEISCQHKAIGNGQTLIGGQRTGSNPGDWKWIDNTPWDYTNWVPVGPNNDGGQSCIQVLSSPFGLNVPWWYQYQKWDDLQCTFSFQTAICKRPYIIGTPTTKATTKSQTTKASMSTVPSIYPGMPCQQQAGAANYRADPTSCNYFYQCAPAGWTRMPCGPGTVWNPNLTVCDWPYNVPGCENSG